LTAEVVRQLRNLKNPEINDQLQKVWGAFHETTADKKKEIEKYTNIYRAGGSTPGDGSRGRLVFSKTCQQCHTLFDTGGKVGPDLTGSNRADLGYILENVVDPNAVIPNDYRASTIELKDERVITGIIKQQDDKSMTVVSANEQLVIPKNEVSKIQNSEISMMPEGLLANLNDQEVRDLIYYLGRPGQVPLPTGNEANLK
jgi:putative heme-binding domain-containing protein